MLRHALRRLLWALPTLVGVSIVTFLFLSYVPDPTDEPEASELSAATIRRIRRERFLDLPRFVNLAPRDVADRATAAALAIAEGGPDAPDARTELARLGGAALPVVLPMLDSFSPDERVEVTLALAPVAKRMGIGTSGETEDKGRVVPFWTRFWDDRGIEFRHAAVRSEVARLQRYRSTTRSDELRELDTFALDDVLGALRVPDDRTSLERARALINLAADVTGRPDRIAPGDDLASARDCAQRWLSYWNVYRSDFVWLRGPARVAAMVLETRYGKWALGAIVNRLGTSVTGASVADELLVRAPVTVAVLFGGINLAYAIAIPLGVMSAARRGRWFDIAIACVALAAYAIPTAIAAVLVASFVGASAVGVLGSIGVLALSLVAAPTRHQRSATLTVLGQDYVRAARARGAGRVRVVVVHALRNALLPVATLAALEAPMALGGAFVVERVFQLHGLGELTIRAVQERDVAWLMALSIVAATVAAVYVLVTDVVYALVDPRLARAITTRRGLA